MYQDIAELEEEVFDFLLDKREEDVDLFFTLRGGLIPSKNKISIFYSNIFSNKEDCIYFSFWNCMIPQSSIIRGRFFISIEISKEGEMSLLLNTDGTQAIENFMGNLLKLLDDGTFETLSSISRLVYIKKYGKWKEGLNIFLNNDKKKIDEYIEHKIAPPKDKFETKIGFISKEQFNRNLEDIKELREHQNKEKIIEQTYQPKGNISLNFLSLKNIGHFDEINLDLSKKVTVLIGENGSGKSTILRTIALGLTGTNFFDLDRDLQREKGRILNSLLKIKDYQKSIPQYTEYGEIMLSINQKQNVLRFSLSKLFKDKVDVEEVDSDKSFILHEGKYFQTIVIGFAQSEREYVGRQFYVKSEMKPSITELFPLISNSAQDIIANLVDWIYYYVHEKEHIEPITKLFTIFSKITEEEVTLKEPYDGEGAVGNQRGDKNVIVCTPNNPNGIHLSLVSQGYKNLFRWVGGILMKVYDYQQNFFSEKTIEEISGIVLIDEIDTYLHPKWQRNILKVLVEEFPELQFVVTTHSAGVLSNLNPKIENGVSMYVISKDTCKEYDFNNLNIYSMDITSILTNRNLFNEPEYPEPMNTKIQQYQKLLERLKNNEARTNPTLFIEVENMHNMLLQDLAQEHPVIIRGNMLMNLKRPQ